MIINADKLLTNPGPLERLFAGSPSAPIIDFLMLVAAENQTYSDFQIARFSGISLKKGQTAISGLQKLGLVIMLEDDGKSGKRRGKKYKLNRDCGIMIPLEKLVLALTDTEIRRKPSMPIQKVSVDIDQHSEQGIGQAATELIEKGLVKLGD